MENNKKNIDVLIKLFFLLAKLVGIVIGVLFALVIEILFEHFILKDNSKFDALNKSLEGLGDNSSLFAKSSVYIDTFIIKGISEAYLILIFALIIFCFVVIERVVSRLSSGTKAFDGYIDRISFYAIMSMVNPFRHLRVYRLIHEFHHEYKRSTKLIKEVSVGVIGIENAIVVDAVEHILVSIKIIVDTLVDDDVAVHIKLFRKKGSAAKQAIKKEPIKNLTLVTYQRYPSRREAEKRRSGDLPKRQDHEKFVTCVKGYATNKIFVEEIRKGYPKEAPKTAHRINLGYLYALQPNEHYFICNDLKQAETKGCYWSNSNNYLSYYQSLAVFLIFPPCIPGASLDDCEDGPFGLLIFDSLSKGKFDSIRLKWVGGLLAHKMNDFFETILK